MNACGRWQSAWARACAGVGFTLLFLCSSFALAQERITAFDTEVNVGTDGTLAVLERIEVEVQGESIRRGILRDFPTVYRDRLGNRVTVPFDVEGVSRDGATENWSVESLRNGERVRIGSADVLLSHGRHVYEIRYRTARQVGFFADHDELYWNVTGNGWTFAIDRASARVRLPRAIDASALSAEAYTGAQGEQGRDWQARTVNGGAQYATTRQLAPGEGLTIVLSFPKGIVAAPTTAQRIGWFVAANHAAGAAALGVLVVFAWLYWRWRQVGRDPAAGPMFPRYEPPAGLSPAAVRYISRMGFDSRCFAAGVLGLGARGYLKLDQLGKDFQLQRTGERIDWMAGDQPLAEALFARGDRTSIGRSYDPQIEAAESALSSALKRKYHGVLFSRNGGSMAIGFLLAALTVTVAVALDGSVGVMIALVVLLLAMLVAFLFWMPSYTVAGRRLQDHIEGLRQYLSVPERDNLAQLKAPELTPAEFARMLPYALALDVEKTWADHFAAVAGSAAVATAVSSWYHSDSFDGGFGTVASLGDSLGDLGSTVSAASTPPSSSSGSGGGGSSGGGGGGGGGSGW